MNELSFTVLGPYACGKTTLLACMNECFGALMPGNFEAGDPETFRLLTEAYKQLERDAEDDGESLFFSGGVTGTDTDHHYRFNVKAGRSRIPLTFTDFPGEWLDPHDPENGAKYSEVERIARESSVIIAVIDSPYLMHHGGMYSSEARIAEIEHVIENSLTTEEKLILIVPVKCERYLESAEDTELLLSTVKALFAHTISLTGETSPYCGRLAAAILPVRTMGNVVFGRFEKKDGRILQVYRKIIGRKFHPEFVDQPLRYALSFLLEGYRRKKSASLLGRLTMSRDLEDVIDSVWSEHRTDIPGSEIFAPELLGLEEDV